jgi:alpha-tubulin suppressor-like RCC1 family protein
LEFCVRLELFLPAVKIRKKNLYFCFFENHVNYRSGQLGLGDTDSRVWPSNVKALQQQKVTYASCGEKHSVVVTLEGGVFSCGSSANGQLGHNSTNDELLPRKISELMGSEVSQIACGR